MKLHELQNTARPKSRKRVGRGDGSGKGRTAGRGDKGAGSRSGYSRRPHFEGGQIPLLRRLPKRGFNNPNHIEYNVINLMVLEENFEQDQQVDKQVLVANGLLSKSDQPLKILGGGEISKALVITADKFSASAREKIERAGGKCVDAKASAESSAPAS